MAQIPLTKGKFALVDDIDYERVSRYNWSASYDKCARTWYAQTNICEGLTSRMHSFILDTFDEIDHRNHDGLDNRRENIRVCSRSQNQMNRRKIDGTSSRFKGVYYHRANDKWIGQIKKDQHQKYLGSFASEEEAARAYNIAAAEMFGEYALLNAI